MTAITLIGYCDGKKIHSFEGKAQGKIADNERGEHGFQWDKIFVPDGYDKTYAELGETEKNEISMRRKAFDEFVKFLKKTPNDPSKD